MVNPLAKAFFTFRTRGTVKFDHALKQFNSKDRVRIVQAAIRDVLKPGQPVLKRRTPRSSGKPFEYSQARKRRKGWVTSPKHGALAATYFQRKSTKRGTIMAKLGYKKGFAWYLNMQSVGFTLRDGSKTKPRNFATLVVKTWKAKAMKEIPELIKVKAEKRLKRLLKAKLKGR